VGNSAGSRMLSRQVLGENRVSSAWWGEGLISSLLLLVRGVMIVSLFSVVVRKVFSHAVILMVSFRAEIPKVDVPFFLLAEEIAVVLVVNLMVPAVSRPPSSSSHSRRRARWVYYMWCFLSLRF
jgi:hypothetical protein